MMKNIVRLEHVVADRQYHLLCDNDSPLVHLKEAIFEFLKHIGRIEDQVKAQQVELEAKKASEEPKVEELKAE